MKILIVEDEEMIREGVSDYLTDCGYETKNKHSPFTW
ncbi:response regulator [Streptococcus pneumoniae]|nr:response regulator [Streptococcus pneumoniae]